MKPLYTITVGAEGATDSCLCINNKQYGVESVAWNLIANIRWMTRKDRDDEYKTLEFYQPALKVIYENFDEDLWK